MRILLIYPGHGYSTKDVAEGYEAGLRELGHEVTTFDYHNSLVYHSHALAYWAKKNRRFSFTEQDLMKISAYDSVIMAVEMVPDVVIIVTGLALHKVFFDILGKQLGLPLALILTESPYIDHVQAKMLPHVHVCFTNDRKSVAGLQALGEPGGAEEWAGPFHPPVHYLPHSFDPARHYPGEVDRRYQYDVFFCGSPFPERAALFRHVRWPWGIRTKIAMPKRKGSFGHVRGVIPNNELAQYYRGSRICLNLHRTVVGVKPGDSGGYTGEHIQRGQAWSLGPRAFEIAACGAFQLTDDSRGELREVFGDSVATFDGTPRDLGDKVRYYLAHDQEREEMAREACRRVQGCSFAERGRSILIPGIEEVL